MPYFPSKPPPSTTDDGTALGFYLEDELSRLAASLLDDVQAVEVRPAHAAPLRPRAGMLVYADGVDWNPGAGEGLYQFTTGSIWAKLLHNNGPGSEGLELGSPSVVGTPYIDFHSSGNVLDFDSRLIATGGNATQGNGALTVDVSVFAISNQVVGNGAILKFAGDGGTTPDKYIKVNGGVLSFINSSGGAVIASLTDAGDLTWTGATGTAVSPALSCSIGAYANAGCSAVYKQFGKYVFIRGVISIVAIGTATGYPLITMPVAGVAAFPQILAAEEITILGVSCLLRVNGATGQMIKYDANPPATAGMNIYFSGMYEAA